MAKDIWDLFLHSKMYIKILLYVYTDSILARRHRYIEIPQKWDFTVRTSYHLHVHEYVSKPFFACVISLMPWMHQWTVYMDGSTYYNLLAASPLHTLAEVFLLRPFVCRL